MVEQDARTTGILVVDGEVLVRHALADYLRRCGYTVIEAASTDEALAVLDEPAVPVDAVLCDAQAPGSANSFELRRQVRASPHRAGVNFVMAGSIVAAAHGAAELCEDGPHLSRPYHPQTVVDHIRQMLGRAGRT